MDNSNTSKQIEITRDPTDGKKIINGYKFIKMIGEGAYGKIKLAIKEDNNYAVKKFNKYLLKKKNKIYKNPDGTTKYVSHLVEVQREIDLHSKLDHPNIIKIIEVIDDEQRDKLYIVMEYAKRGQLLQWNSKTQKFHHTPGVNLNNPDYLKNAFKQILEGLNYLHRNLIVHRDIKPQNILVDHNDDIKICDFGCALRLESQDARIKGTEGTFQFMAPECLKENKNDKPGYLGQLADIWSLGVVMFCVIELKLPFQDDNMLQLFNKIQSESPTFHNKHPMQPIVELMLRKDPNDRPNAKQLLDIID